MRSLCAKFNSYMSAIEVIRVRNKTNCYSESTSVGKCFTPCFMNSLVPVSCGEGVEKIVK